MGGPIRFYEYFVLPIVCYITPSHTYKFGYDYRTLPIFLPRTSFD